MFRVVVEYNFDKAGFGFDRMIEKVAPRQHTGAGTFRGPPLIRDHSFRFRDKKKAEAAVKRLKALKLGLTVSLAKDE